MSAHRIASIRIDQFDGVTPVLECLAEDVCQFHSSDCLVVDWWGWSEEYAEAYVGKPHPFVPGPIEFSVDSGRYVWRYADEAAVKES